MEPPEGLGVRRLKSPLSVSFRQPNRIVTAGAAERGVPEVGEHT
jgi:hypothetical protein